MMYKRFSSTTHSKPIENDDDAYGKDDEGVFSVWLSLGSRLGVYGFENRLGIKILLYAKCPRAAYT